MAKGKALTSDPDLAPAQIASRTEWALKVLSCRPRSRERTAMLQAMMAALGLERTQAYNVVKAVSERGRDGVARKVRSDAGEVRFSDTLREAWIDFASNPVRHHWRLSEKKKEFRRLYTRKGEPFPSNNTLGRWWSESDAALAMTSREFARSRKRYLKMGASYPNHVWQGDQHQADFEVVEYKVDKRTGEITGERRYRPLLFTFADCFSGAVMAGVYYEGHHTGYSTEVVEKTLLAALYPDDKRGMPFCGVPEIIYWDNGKPHCSQWMEQAAASLGIELIFSKPKEPTAHGFIESYHNTIIDRFEKKQPGYVGRNPVDKPLAVRLLADGELPAPDYLTLDQVNAAWQAWLPEYHEAEYRSADAVDGGLCRRVRWERHVAPERRAVPEPRQLSLAFMQRAEVAVHGGEFQHRNVRYTGAGLGDLDELKVQIRYVRGEFRRVWVLLDGEYYCEARPKHESIYRDIANRADLEAQRSEMKASRRALAQSKRATAASATAGLIDADTAEQVGRALDETDRALKGEQGLLAVAEMRREAEPALPENVVRLTPKPDVRDVAVERRDLPDADPYLVPLDGGQPADSAVAALDYL